MIEEINQLHNKIKTMLVSKEITRQEWVESLIELCIQNKRICYAINRITSALQKQKVIVWPKDEQVWGERKARSPDKPRAIPDGWLTFKQYYAKHVRDVIGPHADGCPSPSTLNNLCSFDQTLKLHTERMGHAKYVKEEELLKYFDSEEGRSKFKKVRNKKKREDEKKEKA